ncbi:MAG: hypothetical protein ACJAUL_002962 [Paraglaciecola sp.]|jgi:hypothetical protein
MNNETIKELTWLYSGLLPLVITLLAITIIAFINAKKLRLFVMSWRKRRLLNAIGIRQQHNLIYYDGLDGSFKVDRLILLKDSILLVSLKQYAGNIYCAEKIAEWTQVIDKKSYQFHNPLFELKNQINALQTVVPGITIKGALFFDHTAVFPKGHPKSVLHQGNIPAYFLTQFEVADAAYPVLKAWETLVELSQSADTNEPLRLNT